MVPAVVKVLMQVAEPDVSVTVPQPVSVNPPALKLMLPPGDKPVTAAVKVTVVPATLGLRLLLTVLLLGLLLTTCVTAGEVAAALLMSPV